MHDDGSMSAKLAKSTAARDCIARQWFRFAMVRSYDADGDDCPLAGPQLTMQTSGNLRDLVVAIATSDAFRFTRW